MKENEVGKFLRLLTHDLQNQLGSVDLNLQIIPTLVDENDPAMKTLAPFISRAAMASKDLIDTLIDVQAFARLVSKLDESGESLEAAQITRLDLTRVVSDCALTLKSSAVMRELELQVNVAPNVIGLGVAEDIQRAIKIMTSEALRSSFPGSTVTLAAAMLNDRPQISVQSTQAGLFERRRPTLAAYLTETLLEPSGASLEFPADETQSLLRFLLRPA